MDNINFNNPLLFIQRDGSLNVSCWRSIGLPILCFIDSKEKLLTLTKYYCSIINNIYQPIIGCLLI